MKFTNIIIVLIFIGALSATAQAQACGAYGVTVFVYDNDLEPVKNYSLNLTPLGKDELNGAKFEPLTSGAGGASDLKLTENGRFINEKYKLTISAPGFSSAEKILTFPYCERLLYDILLLGPGQQREVISGKVVDENGAAVPYAKLRFTPVQSNEKYVRRVCADIDGAYEIKLLPGEYWVQVFTVRQVPLVYQKINVPKSGNAVIDLSGTKERPEFDPGDNWDNWRRGQR